MKPYFSFYEEHTPSFKHVKNDKKDNELRTIEKLIVGEQSEKKRKYFRDMLNDSYMIS